MIPEPLREKLADRIARAEDAREQAVDVMFEIQNHYGYMTDEAMREASALLGMTTLELEELATFYDHIYRSPVGRYVIRVCDSTICWMEGHERVVDYISSLLGIRMGGTSADGLFTLLPVVCIGYCDRSPAMTVNERVYGRLTPERIDEILRQLRDEALFPQSE
ncbi:MAG: NADH-quinone oxidoreductase subunit NuoE [Syntrophobacteraceae bacterium]|nr:NADH-quinone oxidoreductase subunit NuoE [Desulfobacteraceae bacterium]